MNWRYLLLWLVLAAVAMFNGIVREATYGKHLPELAAHQVSTATAVLLSAIVVRGAFRYWPPASPRQAWLIGLTWLLMTIAFEFVFGRYVIGHSWPLLLADYNLAAGRVWSLFLAWLLVMPYVFFRFAGAGGASSN